MDFLARRVFRHALAEHYINGIAAGDDVDLWLKTHGGWLPDPQLMYDDGTPDTQPADEGEDVISKDPGHATADAQPLMVRLSETLDKEEDEDLLGEVTRWLNFKERIDTTMFCLQEDLAIELGRSYFGSRFQKP